VGRLYRQLAVLLEKLDAAKDLDVSSRFAQGAFEDWGFSFDEVSHFLSESDDDLPGGPLLVERTRSDDPNAALDAAKQAVKAVGSQGEDAQPNDATDSHFERFLALWRDAMKAPFDTWSVATNPNTSEASSANDSGDPDPPDREKRLAEGRITAPRSRQWAGLFNLRYRMLLQSLHHFLAYPTSETEGGAALYDATGDRTPRGLLALWTFDEMRHLRKIAGKLVRLPLDETNSGIAAGPPFEMPYSLSLPGRELQRWRTHQNVTSASIRLVGSMRKSGTKDDQDPFLEYLLRRDAEARDAQEALAAGKAPAVPTNFAKAARILDEAVRGNPVEATGRPHGAFWRGVTCGEFTADPPKPAGGEKFPHESAVVVPGDPDASPLLGAIDEFGGMPRGRPSIPESRVAAIREWIQGKCMDPNDPVAVVQPDPLDEP
jgi:hypothetical protein